MRARTVTLILAEKRRIKVSRVCCKLPVARARELVGVHGNKSMRIATARRYARNLFASLR